MSTLKAALQEAYLAELEGIPSEEMLSADEALTFTPTFERKINKLIRRADHPIWHRAVRAAACLLLAALLSGCTALAISPEARTAFVGWVQEVYETYFVYRYTGTKQFTPKDVVYRPTWIPDGYAQSLVPELSDQVNILYTDNEGHMMVFAYSGSSASLALYAQENNPKYSQVTVNDIPADFYLDEDDTKANCLVWVNPENDFIFWILAPLTDEELIKIAESVEVVQWESATS